jgi:hypothetical protein
MASAKSHEFFLRQYLGTPGAVIPVT